MAEAYIYDHVRTPRGRGKKDGALHEVPAVRLGDPASPAFLGQTTWLCATPPTADRDDAVLAAA